MTNYHTLDIPLDQLETAESVCKMVHGFPDGRVNRLIETFTKTGSEYRQWCFEYAADGNLSRAWRYHKMAEENLSQVKWWMARQEREIVQ